MYDVSKVDRLVVEAALEVVVDFDDEVVDWMVDSVLDGVLAIADEDADEDVVWEDSVCVVDAIVDPGVALVSVEEVDAEAFEDDELVAVGGRTIVVGPLISMTEYSVAVTVTGLAAGVIVTSTTSVVLGPSTVVVDRMISVVGDKVSVWTTVCVVGDAVRVWTIVTSPCPDVSVEAADPPSTGTTE